MTDKEHSLSIVFENTGERWDKITEYEISDDFMTPTDAWSIVVYDEDPRALRRKFRPLEPVEIYLGDRLQLIGRIDGTEGVGGGSSALKVWGRDYLADLVNPNIDPSIRVTSGMSLVDALLEGLRVFGIDTIEGDVEAARSKKMGPTSRIIPAETDEEARARYRDQFSERPETQAFINAFRIPERRVPVNSVVPDAKPGEGEGAFEWANRLAARAAFTVQPAGSRNALAVVAPDYQKDPTFMLRYPGNIEDGKARRDWGSLPTVVIQSSRAVTGGLEAKGKWRQLPATGDESPASLWQTEEGRRSLVDVGVVASRLRPADRAAPPLLYRPLYHRDDDAKTEEQLERSTRRQLADRMKDTLVYDCTLTGHVDPISGGVYSTNVMASVVDDIEDVNEVLWVVSRKLSYKPGKEGGERTQLKLIRPASYVL